VNKEKKNSEGDWFLLFEKKEVERSETAEFNVGEE